jgi:cytochrome b6-f complex iron-sulfur subunit
MEINRKQFLVLAAGMVAGCTAMPEGSGAPGGEHLVDAGPADAYGADGVYEGFRGRGFFIVRHGGRLFALSSICTHRRCKINPESDRSFTCDCHGSTFDPDGRVTLGPATRDLPVLDSFTNEGGRLLVRVRG